jgi:hypothetical protein
VSAGEDLFTRKCYREGFTLTSRFTALLERPVVNPATGTIAISGWVFAMAPYSSRTRAATKRQAGADFQSATSATVIVWESGARAAEEERGRVRRGRGT